MSTTSVAPLAQAPVRPVAAKPPVKAAPPRARVAPRGRDASRHAPATPGMQMLLRLSNGGGAEVS